VSFSAVTLNAGGLMTGTYFDPGLPWPQQDLEKIAQLMGDWCTPYDVVLLQEVYQYFGDELENIRVSSGHPHKSWIKATTSWRGAYHVVGGDGVLSKHPIEVSERHLYWQKPDDHSPEPEGWPLSYFRIRIDGVPVHFFTAHYPHAFPNKRSASFLANELIRTLPQQETVCFGGDFNGGACTDEVTMVMDGAALELVSGTGGGDIDHILGRHLRVHRTWDHHLVEAGKTLTDHPLVGIEAEARVAMATPRTRIDAGPPQPPQTITERSATLHFSADSPGATFECSLDCDRWQPCKSPIQHTNLNLGQHWFGVRATDSAGNREPVPAGWTWIIVEPETTTVPDVGGMTEGRAATAIRAAGLIPSFIGGTPKLDWVSGQAPEGGTTVRRGTTVTLYLAEEPA
jgi:endonuclease/exonuclease/phosphatase family metal-dependent hydrolase